MEGDMGRLSGRDVFHNFSWRNSNRASIISVLAKRDGVFIWGKFPRFAETGRKTSIERGLDNS